MKQIIFKAAGAMCLIAVASVLFARPYAAPRTAQADPANVLIMNVGICAAVSGITSAACGLQPATGFDYDHGGTMGDQNAVIIANALGNSVGLPKASDFTSAAEFTGGQVHQQTGEGVEPFLGNTVILAFVKSVAPVTFHTTAGFFMENGSNYWTCDGTGPAGTNVNTTPNNANPNCGGPNSTNLGMIPGGGGNPAFTRGPDGLVTAYLSCTAASCPLGQHQLTVEQSGVVYPVNFTVVGEARSVEWFAPKTTLQGGVSWTGNLTNNHDAAYCAVNNCTPVGTACPFHASISYITKALGEAEQTVLVARALDINGTAISGAWINWTVDNNGAPTSELNFSKDGVTPTNFDSQAILSQPVTPTLNLGGFGYGAPNIMCAAIGAAAGKVMVRGTLSRTAHGVRADPLSDPGSTSVPLELAYSEEAITVHAVPAKMVLAAAPATVACDGTSTSSVSAALSDAAGNPAVAGTAVHFDVQVLGTANPIDAVTDKDGVAKSTVTPLSGIGRGLPVTVSVSVGGVVQPDLTQQILVQCSGAAGAGTGPSGGGGGAPPSGAGAPSGTITAPNTGSGGVVSDAGPVSWWSALLLLAAVAALGGVRQVVARRER